MENVCQGTLTIEKESMQVSAVLDTQGQAIVKPQSNQKSVCLVTSFKTSEIDGGVNIHCGCFIPDNRLLLANSFYESIYVCDLDGSNVRSIELQYNPCAVALYDNNKALVSSHRRFVQTIDLDTLKPGSTIGVGLECTVITSVNGNICVRDSNSSLSMVDIDGVERGKISTTSDPLHLSINKVALTSRVSSNASSTSISYKAGQIIKFTNTKTSVGINSIAEFHSTGKFTCEKSGVYLFSVFIGYEGHSNADFILYNNNQRLTYVVIVFDANSGSIYSGSGTVVVQMNVGDILFAQANRDMTISSYYSCFTVLKFN